MTTNVTWHQPSHPNVVKVESGEKLTSRAVSLVSLPAGSIVAPLGNFSRAAGIRYTTVQIGVSDHVEPLSDMVFCNHSCRPTVEFDTATWQVRVVKDRDLQAGDDLTFFYPSSEWDMDQPFECNCKANDGEYRCLGKIQGAKHLDKETLGKYWLNSHIIELLNSNKA